MKQGYSFPLSITAQKNGTNSKKVEIADIKKLRRQEHEEDSK